MSVCITSGSVIFMLLETKTFYHHELKNNNNKLKIYIKNNNKCRLCIKYCSNGISNWWIIHLKNFL